MLTLVGEDAARSVAATAVLSLDLRAHTGAHPRLGVVDVVPFVPLGSSTLDDAIAARDRFGAWAGRRARACPASATAPSASLPDRAPPRLPGPGPRLRARPSPTRRPGPWPSAPDPCWWPTTCGWPSPTSTWPGRWPASCAGRRCGPWDCPSATHVQVSMNLIDPARVGPRPGLRPGRRPQAGDRPGRTGRAGAPRRCSTPSTRPGGRASTCPRTGRSRPASRPRGPRSSLG